MSLSTGTPEGHLKIKRFRQYGFTGGFSLGAIVGFMVAGPHFHEWSFVRSASTILGSGVVLGFLGFLAIVIAYGSLVAGFPEDEHDSDSASSSDGDVAE
jgi:hypothetical protein